MTGNIFRRNIVVYRNPNAALWWSFAHTWGRHRLAEVDFNLYWHTGGLDLRTTERTITPEGNFVQWQKAGFDRHSLIADPQFVAPEKGDFRLQPTSPAFRLGFLPIPVEKVGPRKQRAQSMERGAKGKEQRTEGKGEESTMVRNDCSE